jgi:hypothetical protein
LTFRNKNEKYYTVGTAQTPLLLIEVGTAQTPLLLIEVGTAQTPSLLIEVGTAQTPSLLIEVGTAQTPSLLIEVLMPSLKSERACICVRGASILPLSSILP